MAVIIEAVIGGGVSGGEERATGRGMAGGLLGEVGEHVPHGGGEVVSVVEGHEEVEMVGEADEGVEADWVEFLGASQDADEGLVPAWAGLQEEVSLNGSGVELDEPVLGYEAQPENECQWNLGSALATDGEELTEEREVAVDNVTASPLFMEFAPAQVHPANGALAEGSGQYAYQLAEERIGVAGYQVDRTLNACNQEDCTGIPPGPPTPWIWSVVKFNAGGEHATETQVLPTYSIYEEGELLLIVPQSDPEAFTALDSDSSEKLPGDIE